MQSSHILTVGLCFLACKPFSFWSIFQKKSKKHVFGQLPYCYFCQSRPMVCFIPRAWYAADVFELQCEADSGLSLWILVTVAIKKAEQARDSHFSAFIIIVIII